MKSGASKRFHQHFPELSFMLLTCIGFTMSSQCIPPGNKDTLSDAIQRLETLETNAKSPQCDSALGTAKWYRFQDASGQSYHLATTCVGTNRCGASESGWVNGSHPSADEQETDVKICFGNYQYNAVYNCCITSISAKIKQCSSEYYYKFESLDCSIKKKFCTSNNTITNNPSCNSNPCQNSGTCVLTIGGGYSCRCKDGFIGDHCQTELTCDMLPIGLDDGNIISDSRFTASSFLSNEYQPSKARLSSDRAWEPNGNDNADYLQIDLPKMYLICAMATKGSNKPGLSEWTTHYKIKCFFYENWFYYPGNENAKVFTGNSDQDTLVKHIFLPVPYFIITKALRFIPTSYHSYKALRVELYGLEAKCTWIPVGIERDFVIPDSSFSASSTLINTSPKHARLMSHTTGWMPSTISNQNDYLQIDLLEVYQICGVATQGSNLELCWTKQYKISTWCSEDWVMYPSNDSPKIFEGNKDKNNIVKHDLQAPVMLKMIRFIPTSYHVKKALRVEVYGERGNCTPSAMSSSALSSMPSSSVLSLTSNTISSFSTSNSMSESLYSSTMFSISTNSIISFTGSIAATTSAVTSGITYTASSPQSSSSTMYASIVNSLVSTPIITASISSESLQTLSASDSSIISNNSGNWTPNAINPSTSSSMSTSSVLSLTSNTMSSFSTSNSMSESLYSPTMFGISTSSIFSFTGSIAATPSAVTSGITYAASSPQLSSSTMYASIVNSLVSTPIITASISSGSSQTLSASDSSIISNTSDSEGFSTWSSWSNCTHNCGGGNSSRTRVCSGNSYSCNGSLIETRDCNTHNCPVDGGWTLWTNWSFCSKACGTGFSMKTRTCTNPSPMYGGRDCFGNDREEKPCNNQTCPAETCQFVIRLTEEHFTNELLITSSSAWNSLQTKIENNAMMSYSVNSNVMGIAVISYRIGSVVSTFNVSFSSLDSIQLLQMFENVNMKGKFGTMPSHILSVTPNAVPSDPPIITYIANSSSTSMLLKWTLITDTIVVGYACFYKEAGDRFQPNDVKSSPATDHKMEITRLKKFTNYTFVLLAFNSNGNGVPGELLSRKTDEDVPSKAPGNVKVRVLSSTELQVTWDAIPAEYIHGILLGYNITYVKHDWDNVYRTNYSLIPSTTHSLQLENLGKYMVYTLSVCGYTSKGCGVSSEKTVRTAEDVPTEPPQNFKVKNLTSTSSISITWNQVPRDQINGRLSGYILRYQMTSYRGIQVSDAVVKTRYLAVSETSVLISGLSAFSIWRFEMVAKTYAGEGVSTKTVYGETCKCPKTLYTNYFVLPPYLTKTKRGYSGVFYQVATNMMSWSCGNCINGHGKTLIDLENNGKGGVAGKIGATSLLNDIDDVPQISFPVYGNQYMEKYMGLYDYFHLMNSPGVAFITIDDPQGTGAKHIMTSVLACLPFMAIAVTMALLAGAIVWILESRSNPEQFGSTVLQGIGEGFWWAYISMTTVGYGDKFALTIIGRIFSILWTLTGLVIISILVGSISSALTTVTVKKDIILYGAKVGAIQNSSEHRLGILRNAKVNKDFQYQNVFELKEALKAREIQGILLDLFVAAVIQDELFDSDVKVSKLLEYSFGYGIVLSGAAVVVKDRCRDYMKINIANITNTIKQGIKTINTNATKTGKPKQTNMFDIESRLLKETLMFSSALLSLGFTCGLIWHFVYFKLLKKAKRYEDDLNCYRLELYRIMSQMVKEFYDETMKRLKSLKSDHVEEIKLITKQKVLAKRTACIRRKHRRIGIANSGEC